MKRYIKYVIIIVSVILTVLAGAFTYGMVTRGRVPVYDQGITVTLTGDMSEEISRITEKTLTAVNSEGNEYFYLPAYTTAHFDAVFTGTLRSDDHESLKDNTLLFAINIERR